MAQGIVAQVGGSTLWRWLSREAICPWRYGSWIFPRDPSSPPRPVWVPMRFKEDPAVLHSRQQNRLVNDFAGLTDFYLLEQRASVLRMHPNAPAALKVIDREQRIRAVDSVRWKA